MGKSRRKSHSRSHRKTMKRSRTTKKHYKGGASAWQYVGNEVGNGWNQFKNS